MNVNDAIYDEICELKAEILEMAKGMRKVFVITDLFLLNNKEMSIFVGDNAEGTIKPHSLQSFFETYSFYIYENNLEVWKKIMNFLQDAGVEKYPETIIYPSEDELPRTKSQLLKDLILKKLKKFDAYNVVSVSLLNDDKISILYTNEATDESFLVDMKEFFEKFSYNIVLQDMEVWEEMLSYILEFYREELISGIEEELISGIEEVADGRTIEDRLDKLEKDMEECEEYLITATSPHHYAKYKIQPIDFLEQNNIPFIEGNIIKYVLRYKDKNGMEDLLKAKSYLDKLIKEYND